MSTRQLLIGMLIVAIAIPTFSICMAWMGGACSRLLLRLRERRAERKKLREQYNAGEVECKWTPDDEDACVYCAGEVCALCGGGEDCEHDVIERHTTEALIKEIPKGK